MTDTFGQVGSGSQYLSVTKERLDWVYVYTDKGTLMRISHVGHTKESADDVSAIQVGSDRGSDDTHQSRAIFYPNIPSTHSYNA